MAEPAEHRPAEEEEEAAAAGEDEDTGAQVAPIVKLEEVAVTTGEEDEDVLLDMSVLRYRSDALISLRFDPIRFCYVLI